MGSTLSTEVGAILADLRSEMLRLHFDEELLTVEQEAMGLDLLPMVCMSTYLNQILADMESIVRYSQLPTDFDMETRLRGRIETNFRLILTYTETSILPLRKVSEPEAVLNQPESLRATLMEDFLQIVAEFSSVIIKLGQLGLKANKHITSIQQSFDNMTMSENYFKPIGLLTIANITDGPRRSDQQNWVLQNGSVQNSGERAAGSAYLSFTSTSETGTIGPQNLAKLLSIQEQMNTFLHWLNVHRHKVIKFHEYVKGFFQDQTPSIGMMNTFLHWIAPLHKVIKRHEYVNFEQVAMTSNMLSENYFRMLIIGYTTVGPRSVRNSGDTELQKEIRNLQAVGKQCVLLLLKSEYFQAKVHEVLNDLKNNKYDTQGETSRAAVVRLFICVFVQLKRFKQFKNQSGVVEEAEDVDDRMTVTTQKYFADYSTISESPDTGKQKLRKSLKNRSIPAYRVRFDYIDWFLMDEENFHTLISPLECHSDISDADESDIVSIKPIRKKRKQNTSNKRILNEMKVLQRLSSSESEGILDQLLV